VNDPLVKTIDQIREYAKSLDLIVFYSSIPNDERHTVNWDEKHGGDWKAFLECAKSANTRIAYLHWESFEESEVDEALVALNNDAGDSQSEIKQDKLQRSEIEQFREKVGLTAFLELAFISNGISHIYCKTAEWIPKFEDLTANDRETDKSEELEDNGQKADPAAVKKWARELASHPKYSSCRSDDQREFLLEQLAGEDVGALPLWQILRRAETIYLMEIKEKEEETLSTQARQLRDQGLNMNAIAKKLRISRDRVSGLLAEASEAKPGP
jgi:hypothetical protein